MTATQASMQAQLGNALYGQYATAVPWTTTTTGTTGTSGASLYPYPQMAMPSVDVTAIEAIIDKKLKAFLAELIDKLSFDGIRIPIEDLRKELGLE